jgi:hypothetical protein
MLDLNPFDIGDYVWWFDELWQVKEIDGSMCFISDVGYEVSNVNREWVHYSELGEDDSEDEDDE